MNNFSLFFRNTFTCAVIFILCGLSFSNADPIEDANSYAVRIKSSINNSIYYDGGAGTSNGAGFLVDKERGWVITNAHVSGYGTAELEVSFKDERYSTAQVLYADNELDLALVMVSKRKIPNNAIEAKLECSNMILNGREVAAFGHPEGLSYSASRGIISQVRVYDRVDWIQTDAAINSGNSGGPLIDLETGKVLGVNSMALEDTEGLNFAVPAKPICRILEIIRSGGSPLPPRLPISFAENEETEEYMIVAGNRYGELPKGIQIGDLVTKVNGIEVKSPTEVHTMLRGGEGKAIFTIEHDNTESDIEIEFPFEEEYLSEPYVLVDGALIAEARFNEFRYNDSLFQIHSLENGSYGSRAGLFAYAYIMAINGKKPETISEIYKSLNVDKEVKLMLRTWSSRDQYLYDFYEVVYKPDEIELKNAM
ncbi:S1C family serine protease [Candidatus Puniceispirillum marinum]|uniref:Peptidase S1 and S6, chymotrypsin/Hap n=1 Tax=Puniceispirillum marinum (strain IMCC1322) TaxID=488538 RepID=D5BPE5_PUNMI|nr:trypsin-like peptidase domain-containing protein [Candidatus Puniceispirillum marinum]ADE38427.1 Peptidase S1 and S6, chymotrypsin/Hap [Candidatus Puniceispirillum marinum IMCC1322]